MNDRERELWVMNDESLHNWWRQSRLAMRQFIRTYRAELTEAINAALGN